MRALLIASLGLLLSCATGGSADRAGAKKALAPLPPQVALPPAFAQAEVIEAVEVLELPADGAGLPEKAVPVVAQRTVKLNDKDANAKLGRKGELSVRAAYTATELAVFVSWEDDSQTVFDGTETNSYGDSVAIELPHQFGPGVRLPHIGMGDTEQWVDVYMARAAASGVLENRYVAAGFGSLTRAPALKAAMTMTYSDGRWHARFVRPLVDAHSTLTHGLVPIAFATWDGARHERGAYKALSSWKFLQLARFPASEQYVAELAWGYEGGEPAADPVKGKQVYTTVCLACHRNPDFPFALEGMAPDLTDVGAIALPAYLRESIQKPSSLIVHHLNPNRAYDRNAKPDRFGAYPNNPALDWYTVGPDGKKLSKMPELPQLTDADVKNLIAYMRAAGGEKRAGP